MFVLFVVSVLGSELSTKKMATIDYSNYDFLAGAVENQEYERSTWHTDQRHFARSERRVITVYKRDMDDSHDVTLFALENVIALIVSREHSSRFGVYKQIFFDTFLDIPLLRKSIRTMRLATETLVCVVTILPLNAALERS